MPQIRRLSRTLCYVIFTFLCTFSACYAMRSVMSQINEHDDDDDDDDDDDVLTHPSRQSSDATKVVLQASNLRG